MMPEFEVELDRVATGGSALGAGPDGRIVFVPGGLPGERVLVTVAVEHPTRLEAELATVVEPVAGRVAPRCPHVAEGCGGCDWQHVDPRLQRELRRAIVVDCLTRLAGIEDPDVRLGPALEPTGYRTSIRAAVRGGRAGYRRRGSHRTVTAESCVVAHPLAEELLVEGRFGPAEEVSIRVGARTGERLVVVHPTAEAVSVPGDVTVIGDDEISTGRPGCYHEEIAGRRLRISARSFFQCRPDGAELLIELAGAAIEDAPGPVLDAYCGVGLFGAVLGPARGDPVIGVESNPWAIADARANYRRTDSVVRASMTRWRPRSVGAIVADPARDGLGRRAADRLASAGAEVIALVSCDPASLARDAGLLSDRGYDLDRVTVVDLFGQTSHVETVCRFVRRGRR